MGLGSWLSLKGIGAFSKHHQPIPGACKLSCEPLTSLEKVLRFLCVPTDIEPPVPHCVQPSPILRRRGEVSFWVLFAVVGICVLLH